MPVKLIFESLEASAAVDEIVEWSLGISKSQEKAAVAFASRIVLGKGNWAEVRKAAARSRNL